jgi:replication-associated recombination protein RarA
MDDTYELASAVQKCIRRGKERDALHFAMRLVPKDERFLWIRLETIAHEDIGLANPIATLLISQWSRTFFYFRAMNRNGSARLVLANAVCLLARSPKSRLADHLQCCVSDDVARGIQLPIPDEAIDKHTKAGKRRGRGVKHWLTEGCVLNPAPSAEFETYREEAEERWLRGVEKLDWSGKPQSATGDLFEGTSDDEKQT